MYGIDELPAQSPSPSVAVSSPARVGLSDFDRWAGDGGWAGGGGWAGERSRCLHGLRLPAASSPRCENGWEIGFALLGAWLKPAKFLSLPSDFGHCVVPAAGRAGDVSCCPADGPGYQPGIGFWVVKCPWWGGLSFN